MQAKELFVYASWRQRVPLAEQQTAALSMAAH
jgi:hypothetical protein